MSPKTRAPIGDGSRCPKWTPDLGDERIYTVEGKETLGGDWGPTNEATRFFRVKVGMPE